MTVIEEGRVCLKKTGRDAGSRCVILKKIDEKTVEIASSGRKKTRKCNVKHLEPLDVKVNPKNKEEVEKSLKG